MHYASIYFQRKKPRLFHSFSLEELISYTTEVPLRPLHFIHQLITSTVLEIEHLIEQHSGKRYTRAVTLTE